MFLNELTLRTIALSLLLSQKCVFYFLENDYRLFFSFSKERSQRKYAVNLFSFTKSSQSEAVSRKASVSVDSGSFYIAVSYSHFLQNSICERTCSVYSNIQARLLEPAFYLMQDNIKYFKVDPISGVFKKLADGAFHVVSMIRIKKSFREFLRPSDVWKLKSKFFRHFMCFLTNCRLICSQIRYCLLQKSCQFLYRCSRVSSILQSFCSFLARTKYFLACKQTKVYFWCINLL